MIFFKQLLEIAPNLDMTIKLQHKDGKIALSLVPEIGSKDPIVPIVLTGTPEELDEGFFLNITPPVHAAGLVVKNVKEMEESVKAAAESKQKTKATPTKEKKQAPAKTPNKSKPGPKKKGKQTPKPKPEKT